MNKNNQKKSEIIIGVTGGIASYKTIELVNLLTKKNYNVHVIMTNSTLQFIQPLTFAALSHNEVYTKMFDQHSTNYIPHIELAKKADCLIIAPATANIIAKIAQGICDDLLTTTILAINLKVPVIICPAMNTEMYNNPITQTNLKKLKELGYTIINPRTSILACGDEGIGAMVEIEEIEKAIKKELKL